MHVKHPKSLHVTCNINLTIGDLTYVKCAACHLHVTCILLGKTCVITVRYMLQCMLHAGMLHAYCMQGKYACMNMCMSHAW